MNGGLVMRKNWNPNIFFENTYKYFDLCELINWSMEKCLGWLDLEIRKTLNSS